MPRFSMKSLLIAFAVVALWMSTFAGYWGGRDVRLSIMLLVLIASVCAAVYGSGSRRAFWGSFFVVVLLMSRSPGPLNGWETPSFGWLEFALSRSKYYSSGPGGEPSEILYAMIQTIRFGAGLILGTLAGYIAAYIYDQSQQNKDG